MPAPLDERKRRLAVQWARMGIARQTEIARHLHVSTGVVGHWVRNAGIDSRAARAGWLAANLESNPQPGEPRA